MSLSPMIRTEQTKKRKMSRDRERDRIYIYIELSRSVFYISCICEQPYKTTSNGGLLQRWQYKNILEHI